MSLALPNMYLHHTNFGRCTIYVQYLYNICTIGKRTNIVQVLYNDRSWSLEGLIMRQFENDAEMG